MKVNLGVDTSPVCDYIEPMSKYNSDKHEKQIKGYRALKLIPEAPNPTKPGAYEVFDPLERMTYNVHWEEGEEIRTPVPSGEDHVLVGSKIRNMEFLHAPAIDIDFPVRVVESRTPGHSHLYIDYPLSWEDYQKLLDVMVEVGIVQKGYVGASKERGQTMLRSPAHNNFDLSSYEDEDVPEVVEPF